MEDLIKKIEKILNDFDNKIDSKIIGTNFLDKLKYFILEQLGPFDKILLEKISEDLKIQKNNLIKSEFKNSLLKYSLSYYKDSISKIKSSYESDTLTILIKGFKTISIFDLKASNKSVTLTIRKNMGIVLSKDTITSENIASESIILDINKENFNLGIEK